MAAIFSLTLILEGVVDSSESSGSLDAEVCNVASTAMEGGGLTTGATGLLLFSIELIHRFPALVLASLGVAIKRTGVSSGTSLNVVTLLLTIDEGLALYQHSLQIDRY